ncbi:SLAP domain-containing protein [Ornithinibacillus scapharcae]|uniref:SLAP domain-containing protein n=1 Tax=Ornithinibacillus scapharcae TaxID=1147159 RepID=UPI000225B6B3|nr:SLAP domain-containing protein [Ornithinibacillus scapharcae]
MQNLTYEAAWERAISDKDRSLVEKTFEEVTLTDKPIQFTTLRIDRNYKNELLILVLVHNITNEECTFHKKRLNIYMETK